MIEYTVTQTIQSGDNEPVDITMYVGEDIGQALAALTGAALPWEVDTTPTSLRMKVLSARITHEETPPKIEVVEVVEVVEDDEREPCLACRRYVNDHAVLDHIDQEV